MYQKVISTKRFSNLAVLEVISTDADIIIKRPHPTNAQKRANHQYALRDILPFVEKKLFIPSRIALEKVVISKGLMMAHKILPPMRHRFFNLLFEQSKNFANPKHH